MLGISGTFAAGFSGDGRCFRFRDLKEDETDSSVNRPDSGSEISYEPIIIDIPDGPIPAGETCDNEVSATDIAENDIPTSDSFKRVHFV